MFWDMYKPLIKLSFLISLMLSAAAIVFAEDYPVFDAHIHYSDDVRDAIPPEQALQRLREAGIVRALVSSSGDDGTQQLYQADPTFIIPSLRPYRTRGTTTTWIQDDTVIPYLKERLSKYRYVAIGELHLQGAQADLPVMREVVKLAKQHQLMLHVHSDADAIKRIFRQNPDAYILWAHAGFEYAYVVRELLEQQSNLWADLSFRREIFTNDRFLQDWRELLIDHADRFMLGIDTYEPQRWLQLQSEMRWQQELLKALPPEVAKKIAIENGLRVIAKRFDG